jgi:hypothetical protein
VSQINYSTSQKSLITVKFYIMLFSTTGVLAFATALASSVNGKPIFLLAGDSTTHDPAGKMLCSSETRNS